jgi:heat shock protein HslJ
MSIRIPRRIHRTVQAALIAATAVPLLAATASAAEPVTARGNEPFWHLEIGETELTFRPLEGDPIAAKFSVHSAQGFDLYLATTDGGPLVAVLGDAICVDTMSGMPFPKTAVVVIGDHEYSGCGGVPATLLQREWSVQQIKGVPILDGTEPTIAFAADGSIYGSASCNRYFGSFSLTGEGLAISETGTSMMMCEPEVMTQEQNLLMALESVQRFEIGPAGELILVGSTGEAIVASPN